MHRVYDGVNRRLTIWGIDRRQWMFAALLGVTIFTATASLLAGLLLFGTLYGVMRAATHHDPQMLRILARGTRYHRRYDSSRYTPGSLRITRRCDASAR